MSGRYLGRDLIEPRVYQEVIYARCKEKNCLVVLPTGLGKTLIAMMVADYRLSKYGGKVLMLAPTKPLALQHAESFRRLFNLPPERINTLTGEMSPEERAETWKRSTIVTATPQTVENDVLTGRISLEDVVLLILDEAHRAVGRYSYVFIANEYLRTAKHPLIMGLTASPGSDEEKIREVMRNLHVERLEVRTERSPDVRPYVQGIKLKWVSVTLPEVYVEVRKLLRKMLRESLKPLAEAGLVSTRSPDISKTELLKSGARISGMIAEGDHDALTLRLYQAKAMKLQHAIELLETQGLSPLVSYLKKLRGERTRSSREILADPKMRKVLYILSNSKDVEHPKMEKLREIVLGKLREKPDAKIIVFTNYRETGRRIKEELERLGVKAERFVGQASRSGDKGMAQRKQKEILDRFSKGEFNVLIATSVGEEGLDVPEVDTVVFYEPVPSAIRSIQRRGRTGRHRPGEVFVLVTKGTRDEAYYWSSRRKERVMFRVMMKLAEEKRMTGAGRIKPLDSFLRRGGTVRREERPERETKTGKNVRIYVDSRELRSGVPKALRELGAEIDVVTLDVADYVLSEDVGVERKSANDFIQSIIDGRLFEQAKRLTEAYRRPLILVEGELYGVRNVHPNAIRGAVAALTLDLGIPVIFTRDQDETAQYLLLIAKREQLERRKEVKVRSEKKALSLAERQRLIVEGLPNVSATLAKRLLRHFGSVERVFTATEEELREVEGIGEKKAREIRRVITAPYVEEDVEEG